MVCIGADPDLSVQCSRIITNLLRSALWEHIPPLTPAAAPNETGPFEAGRLANRIEIHWGTHVNY